MNKKNSSVSPFEKYKDNYYFISDLNTDVKPGLRAPNYPYPSFSVKLIIIDERPTIKNRGCNLHNSLTLVSILNPIKSRKQYIRPKKLR